MTTSKTEIHDRDLMRYYDGELDAEREAEIERWLDGADLDAMQQEGLDKLAGLALVGELLRESVDGDDRADGVVDAVMAQLDELDEAPEAGDEEDGEAAEEAALDDAALDGGDRPPKIEPPKEGPANDNAARIYMLAAAAAAAAAGLFIWGSQGQDLEPPPHARSVPPVTATIEATARPAAPPAPPTAVAVEEEDEGGVEIAAVDFGAQRGSVFYVGDASVGRTAVVWINDAGEP